MGAELKIHADDLHWFEPAFQAWDCSDFEGCLDALHAAVSYFIPTPEPVIVPAYVSADDANRLYGEAFGVDWRYEGAQPYLVKGAQVFIDAKGDMRRDAEIELLRESTHYANGVADLATKHRDLAESRLAAADALLREVVMSFWFRRDNPSTVKLLKPT